MVVICLALSLLPAASLKMASQSQDPDTIQTDSQSPEENLTYIQEEQIWHLVDDSDLHCREGTLYPILVMKDRLGYGPLKLDYTNKSTIEQGRCQDHYFTHGPIPNCFNSTTWYRPHRLFKAEGLNKNVTDEYMLQFKKTSLEVANEAGDMCKDMTNDLNLKHTLLETGWLLNSVGGFEGLGR